MKVSSLLSGTRVWRGTQLLEGGDGGSEGGSGTRSRRSCLGAPFFLASSLAASSEKVESALKIDSHCLSPRSLVIQSMYFRVLGPQESELNAIPDLMKSPVLNILYARST